MIAAALLLMAAPLAQAPSAAGPLAIIDDSTSSYCLATGFCRRPADARGPAPGVLFVATGLVGIGVAGLRARPRP
jgi:hypothetical protein